MTDLVVDVRERVEVYTALEGQTAFNIPFEYDAAAHVRVRHIAAADGAITEYSTTEGPLNVAPATGEEGVVTLPFASVAGDKVIVYGDTTPARAVQYSQKVKPGSLNQDGNRLIMLIQELIRDRSRVGMLEFDETPFPAGLKREMFVGRIPYLNSSGAWASIGIDELGGDVPVSPPPPPPPPPPPTPGTGTGEVVYATIAALAAAEAGTSGTQTARVIEAGRAGVFVWLGGNVSALVAADPLNGIYVPPDSDDTGAGGAWMRIIEDEVNVLWYGAKGDGSADDTAAFQAAVASGLNVYIPRVATGNFYSVSSVIPVTTAGQLIRGGGYRSEIRQSGTAASSNVFSVNGVAGVEFEKLGVRPGDSTNASGSTFWGYAFYFAPGSHQGKVKGCEVTQHRRGAIIFVGSNECEALGNYIHDSIVDPNGISSLAGVDIFICNGSNRCKVKFNSINTGAGTGIGVQSVSASQNNDNVISNNVVFNCYTYGIVLYVGDANDEVDRNIVANNVVDTVYGSIESAGQGGQPFGCGIYIQGAEHTTCTANSVYNTCINTDTELLTPAGIGMTNARAANISFNTVVNSQWYGIMVVDVNDNSSFPDQPVTVNGNKIYMSVRAGIYGKDMAQAIANDNTIIGSGSQGILVRNTTTTLTDDWTLNDNKVRGVANTGIEVQSATSVTADGNTCRDCGSRGMVFDSCGQVTLNGGTVRAPQGIGIYFLNSSNISATGTKVYDAGQGGVQTDGIQLANCIGVELTNVTAKNLDANTSQETGIRFTGTTAELHIVGGEFQGSVADVDGTAPPNIRWDGTIAHREAGFDRKDRQLDGTTLNVNRYDKHLHITEAGTIATINTSNSYSGQELIITFGQNVTFDHGASNVFCPGSTDLLAGPSGSGGGRLNMVRAIRTNNNWQVS